MLSEGNQLEAHLAITGGTLLGTRKILKLAKARDSDESYSFSLHYSFQPHSSGISSWIKHPQRTPLEHCRHTGSSTPGPGYYASRT